MHPGRLRWIPAIAIAGPFLVSLLAWLGPVHGSRLGGYDARTIPSPTGVALLVLWVGLLVLVATLGFDAGLRAGGFRGLRAVGAREVHLTAVAAAAVGTGWAYWVATGGNPGVLVDLWRNQQFNALRYGLEYGMGVHTLRYAAIIAGGMSLAHLVLRNRPRLIDAASLATLVASAFLASRLSVVMAVFVAAGVVLGSPERRRLRLRTVVIALAVLTALFTSLNYSRNAGTYRDAGIGNPLAMAAVNAQGYLATPMQVGLGASTGMMDGRIEVEERPGGGLGALVPTFVINQLGLELGLDGVENQVRYQDAVMVDGAFTTNGSLPDLTLGFGWTSLPGALLLVGLVGVLAARLALSGPAGLPFAGALVYGFAELWRIFLLNQGIYQFLLLMGLSFVVLGWLRMLAPTRAAPRPGHDRVHP